MSIKYTKDVKTSVRVSAEVKAALKALGGSVQKALDAYIEQNWPAIEKKIKNSGK